MADSVDELLKSIKQLKFRFTKKDVTELLENAEGYSDEIRKRVETIIFA